MRPLRFALQTAVVLACLAFASGAGARADRVVDVASQRMARAALGGFHTGWSRVECGEWVSVRRQAELFVDTGAIARGLTMEIEWRSASASTKRVSVFWNRTRVFTGALPRKMARVAIPLPETKAGRQEIGFDFSGGGRFRSVMGASRRQRGRLDAGRSLAVVSFVLVPAELPALTAPPPACAVPSSPEDPFVALPALPNVLLYVVDTLRGDHVGRALHGIKTPNFDRVAANGVSFQRAIATSSWSKPTIATLLTGLYPGEHGCNAHDDKLPATKAIPTLAEGFRAAGRATAAVVANGYIAARHGFVRGFEFVKNPLREGRPYRAERLNDIALKWLRARPKGKPFFLHMQPVDPHVPYNPPRRFWSRFFSGRYAGPLDPVKTGDQLDLIKSRALRLGERDRAFLHALYDGAVEYTDFAFGELMKALDALGLAKETLVVITADHGEEFWEHGAVGHAHTVYEELVRVPLVVGTWHAPDGGGARSGRVVESTVSTTDLVSALRNAYRLNIGKARAIDLTRPVFSIVKDRVASATWGLCKYVLWRGGDEELFRLDTDATESQNLVRTEPNMARVLRGRFAEWFAFENHPTPQKVKE